MTAALTTQVDLVDNDPACAPSQPDEGASTRLCLEPVRTTAADACA